jgi:outer membrane protein
LYQAARGYDASYQSARQQALATVAHGEQARAGILPSVNLGASVSQTNQTSSLPAYDALDYKTQSGNITASMPLYRPANWAAYEQGKKQIDSAQPLLVAAEQDLILRVSQAYFDVLTASDNLAFIRAQKVAVAEQLGSAQRNFEVGTATIVDTRDAQARYDLVAAQELAADNDLRVKSMALDQLVGKNASTPKPLRTPLVLPPVLPADIQIWVQQAQQNNPQLQQLQIALDIAKLETSKAQAGHLPTLDLIGSYSASNNNGTMQSSTSYTLNQGSIGLIFNLPLYAGRSIENRVKETLALEDKARSDLEAAQRSTEQNTRTAYLGLVSGMSQVQAYEAAQISSQSALDANQVGYQVGVKINIDVLNAQSQLYSTKATLAKSRYDVLMGALKLRQASGTLRPSDLDSIDALLQD